MIVNIEKVVADYLRDELDARVVAKTPDDTSTSWVKATLIAAPSSPTSKVDHLVEFMVQFDCYAGAEGGQPEAMGLALSARQALSDMPETDFDDAVITAVRFSSMNRLPDEVVDEPARERVILDALIHAHPTPGGS